MKEQIIMSKDEYNDLTVAIQGLLYNIKQLEDSYRKNEFMRYIEDVLAICKLEDE